jgi:hypothetical protein
MAGRQRLATCIARLAFAAAAGALLAPAGTSGAALTIDGASTAFTGAAYTATANASDPASVVLYEWDFDGDGAVDVNRTGDPAASHVYAEPSPDYLVRLNVTRLVGAALVVESASLQLRVDNGTPTVAIDLPDRLVSGVDLTFSARASDPDPSPGGEPFAYRWTIDGAAVGGAGEQLVAAVSSPGAHEIAVVVTDAEGLTRRAAVTPEFASPGPFEGKGGAVALGLLTAFAALGLGLPLVVMQRREARRAAASKAARGRAARAGAEGGGEPRGPPTDAAGRRLPPTKAPFAASSEGAAMSAPRILVGGTPSAHPRTRECVVCHNAVPEEVKDCPYCEGNERARAFEAQLEAPPYNALDLSEVRGVLHRARLKRHLAQHDEDRALIAEAQKTADRLARDAESAREWLPQAEAALAAARGPGGEQDERAERAEAYVKLAQSMASARLFGKAERHARKAIAILKAPAEAAPEPAPGPEALEARVRADISAVRGEIAAREGDLDAQVTELLHAAQQFEAAAEWMQAAEVLEALREKLARAREAAQGPAPTPEGGGEPPQG